MEPRLMKVRGAEAHSIPTSADVGRDHGSSPTEWLALHPGLVQGRRTARTLEELSRGLTDMDAEPARAWVRASIGHLVRPRRGIQLAGGVVDLHAPVVMGIVNVTPDSFSDGGRHRDADAAISHGLSLVEAGAAWLDIGGESTRPRGAAYGDGAVTVSVQEELDRVVPVIEGLRARVDAPLSIDTRKSVVARAAIAAGARVINDVSGLRHDPALASVAAQAGAGLVLMHTPVDIEQLQHELPCRDLLGEVLSGLRWSVDRALASGVGPDQIAIDPGLGFGKPLEGNRFLLRHLDAIRALGYPLLVGASRKRFLVEDGAIPPLERVGASVAAALIAARGGASILRVHDVRETVQALALWRVVDAATDPSSDAPAVES